MLLSAGSRQAFSMAAGWLVSGAVVAAAIVYSNEITDAAKALLGLRSPAPAATAAQLRSGPRGTVGRVVELHAGAQGHYFSAIAVNGRSIDVMVDTGASIVALTYEDARRAGIHVRGSDFTQVVQTANGAARFAPVVLGQVEIGSIMMRDVTGAVAEPGKLETTLLGMSFLGRLQRVDMRSGRMVLAE